MVKINEGDLISRGKRYGLIASRFNEFITQKLIDGAVDALKRHGAKEDEIEIFWVPGCFEVPYAAKKIAKGKKFDAIVGLGAIIRGDTSHSDYIAGEAAKGIAKVSLETDIPVIFGIITAETIEQAIERAGTKEGNKGFKAAVAAIEMVNLYQKIK